MTSNDLETLNGHFTLNFQYYEPHFQQLGYILTVEYVYTRDQRNVRKGTVIRRIFGIREKLLSSEP